MISEKTKCLNLLQEKYSKIEKHLFSDFSKNKIVWGTGNINSEIIFLGEGPGAYEDLIGEPFVGKAGQLLTEIILASGFLREDVYITNVIKCRLKNNRRPTFNEIEYEKKEVLNEEIQIINPKIICSLGASATIAMLGANKNLKNVRGHFFYQNNLIILPTYHPAYLLRNPSAKKIVLDDLRKIKILLQEILLNHL